MRTGDDPLLQCLKFITKYHDNPQSENALLTGFPLVNGFITADTFIRSAKRAGFAAKMVHSTLENFKKIKLPAVLLTEEGDSAVVLLEINSKKAEIILPESGDGQVSITIDELEELYTGDAIYIKPMFDYSTYKNYTPTLSKNQDHWFWGSIRQAVPVYAEVVAASLIINLFALAMPMYTMNVYDRVVPNSAVETLWVLSIGIGCVILFDLILKSLRVKFLDTLGKQADMMLSSKIYQRVLNLKYSNKPERVGVMVNNLREFDTFREYFTSTALATLIDIPFALLFVLFIYKVGGPIAFIPLACLPIVVIVGLIFHYRMRRAIESTQEASSIKQSIMYDSLVNMESIKSYCAEGFMQGRWEQVAFDVAKGNAVVKYLSAVLVNLVAGIQQVATVLIVIFGVHLIQSGDLSMGGLIACSMLSGRAISQFVQLASIISKYYQSKLAYDQIDSLMELEVERDAESNYVSKEEIEGNIQFSNVNFTYPDQPMPALVDLNLKIKAGEKVAILGRIGSGKSTLQRLLMGFYEVDSGSIIVDDMEIRHVCPTDLRRNIGYVPQMINLQDGTLKDNITLGNPHIDDQMIIRASNLSGVSEFAKLHPSGLNMHVGEGGANLSGGQKQAIAVARALLLNPNILIMDEPTANMDSTTEQWLINNLRFSLIEKTLILVTHKPALLELVDKIVVLDRGKVVMSGPKEKVLEALKKRGGAPI